MAQVLTNPRFLDDVALDRLRKLGIDIKPTAAIDALELPEPRYGEAVVGELTDEEALLFRELYDANQALETRTRELIAAGLTKAGDLIRHSDRHKPLSEVFKNNESPVSFDNEADGLVYFTLQQRAAMLHATFYFAIGERLGLHDWRLGVRSRARVVKIERRW